MVTEVNKGYIKYEVGEFPEDWNVILIGDSLKFKNGLNKESEYFGYGTPIVNYMDVFNNHGIKQKNIEGKVFLNREEKNSFSAKKGDVFFTRTSETQEEIGNSAVLLENIDDCVFSGFILRGRPKNNIVLPEYYQYCLTPNYVRNQIISTSSYTTRALTNGRFLSKVKLIIPPTLEEQKSIATALSDVDELISGLEKLISKKKDIKRGAAQALLSGKIRLNGFGHAKEMKESQLGLIPKDWDVKLLPEVFNYIHGKAHEQHIDSSGTYTVVNSKFISSEGKVSKQSSDNFCPAKKGDILTVLSDLPNGKALAKTYYVNVSMKYAVNQRICIWRSKKDYPLFLSYIMNRHKYFMKFDDGVTQTHILNHHIEKCPVLVPSDINEQKAIAKSLNEMDAEITQLQIKKEKYQALKQGMMQELLTGKIRLV